MTEPVCTYNVLVDCTNLDIRFPSLWLIEKPYPNIAIADELRKLADLIEKGVTPS